MTQTKSIVQRMDVVFDKNDAADWIYRGEGAVNLVLAYSGSSTNLFGKVMRIQKAPRDRELKEIERKCGNGGSSLGKHEQLLWRDNVELVWSSSKEIMERIYVEQIMSPLLGPKFVDPGMHVRVTRDFLQSLQENVKSQRPAWRVHAAEVDIHCDSALLMSDHTVFPQGVLEEKPCLAVEIKPKCGFVSISRFIAKENAIKRSVTRFRLHQALKLSKQEISEMSEYDPLDLFSGSKERIHKAIRALCTTPQNNFRVFLNGSLIFGGSGGGSSTAVGEAFEHAIKGVIKADDGLHTNSFIQLVAQTVHQAGILDRLLEVQKLDNFDIEGAIHAYYNIISEPCKVCRELDEKKASHPYASLHSASMDESLKIVKDYLISATAKDCSLIFCFKPKGDDVSSSYNSVYLASTNQFFDYKVHFIDLDLKPLKKMEDYYAMDKKIVSCYIQTVNAEHGKNKSIASNTEKITH